MLLNVSNDKDDVKLAVKSVMVKPSTTFTVILPSRKYLFFRTFARVLWLATIVTEWIFQNMEIIKIEVRKLFPFRKQGNWKV